MNTTTKLIFITSLIFIFLISCSISATVKPSITQMVSRSDIILIGKVVDVESPREQSRIISIKVQEYLLKKNSRLRAKELIISYNRIGKGDINFQKLKEQKKDLIFFLMYTPDSSNSGKTTSFHLKLADEWFGIESNDKTTLKTIKSILKK